MSAGRIQPVDKNGDKCTDNKAIMHLMEQMPQDKTERRY